MENSSIRSPQKPVLANQGARQAGLRQVAAGEDDSSGSKLGFSQLLADVAGPSLVASPGEAVDPAAGAAVEWSGLTPQAMAEAGMFSLASLVGQTARLDGAAEAAQRDGRTPQSGDGATGPAALPMGAGQRAPGQPAAAPGLQTHHAKGAGADAGAGTGTALAQGAAATLDTSASPQTPSTLSLTQAAGGAERSTPPPGLAALLAQMEAVPVAAADRAAAPLSGAVGSAAAADTGASPVGTVGLADTAAHAPAEGAEATPAADAVLSPPDEAQADALSEQVAFWVQQKTQRAEMTIDRQGQPVKVQVVVTGGEAHVTFRSNEQQTRDMLDASTAQLRELLEQQGLTLAGVSVQTADAGRQDSGASAGGDGAGRSPAQRGDGGAPLTAVVSADLRARPDALRAVDLFV